MNRALTLHTYGGTDSIRVDGVAEPVAGSGQVIVQVAAAGVNAFDWKIREGYLRDVLQLPLPVTLGVEFAGTIVEIGPEVASLAVGDRVLGVIGGIGAYADRIAVNAGNIAKTPSGLSDTIAAAIPVVSLTAWQALHRVGQLKSGQRVLIHGAAGGVGSLAVQFAHEAGAEVWATARASNADYVERLGADRVIDYRTSKFWERTPNFDLVLDLVGGEDLDRSWQILSPGGIVISASAPDILARTPAGRRSAWLEMQPDGVALADFAQRFATHSLQLELAEVADLVNGAEAIERVRTGHARGKVVIAFTDGTSR